MIESIEVLFLAIPFLLAAVFVFQTMAGTSRSAAWAAPATVRATPARRPVAAPAPASNVTELFGGVMTLDQPDLAAAA